MNHFKRLRRSYIKRKPRKQKTERQKIVDKLPTAKKEKKKAWKEFSIFIRTRDCLKTTGMPNQGRCYTCDKLYPFKSLQAGHLVAGRTNSVLFDEQGVKAQCYHCNIHRSGEPLLFRRKLVKEIGEELVQLLEDKRYRTQKYTMSEYLTLQGFYRQKTKDLLEYYKKVER